MSQKLHHLVVVCCSLALAIGPAVQPVFSQPPPVQGRVAGHVYDRASGQPVHGAVVEARLVTTNELFTSPGSDTIGSFLISDVPAGIYAFAVVHGGISYPVDERFDVRVGTDYLFEACFELDPGADKATVRTECWSGLYAQNQVVSLAPHRFFRPDRTLSAGGAASATQSIAIAHDGVECVVSDFFPVFEAGIDPESLVAVGRVFFRAAQHPDFYYVDLQRAADGRYEAILPRPSPETTEFVYYIEALDTSFNPIQTQEFSARVMHSNDCRDRDPAALFFTGDNPGIIVGSTVAGAAQTPPGFLPGGIVSFVSASGSVVPLVGGVAAAGAGGGIGATGIVLIVGAGAAAATAFAIQATNEQQASPIQ